MTKLSELGIVVESETMSQSKLAGKKAAITKKLKKYNKEQATTILEDYIKKQEKG